MYKAKEIAYWFINKNNESQKNSIQSNEDFVVYDGLTHFKLQGLLYNAQGCCLAMYDKPLFEESIDAWEQSPIIENIYDSFCVYKQSPIILPYTKEAGDAINKIAEDEEATDVLEFVYQNFNCYTAWELKEMDTCEGTPYAKTELDNEINTDEIKKYFKEEVIVEE